MKHSQGFVALLDVLGFRNLVADPASEKHLTRYLQAVEEGISSKGDTRAVEFVLFSDSIVITTNDDQEQSLRVLLRACSRLLGLLLENGIPVRGAVAHGPFFRETRDNGVFVAGRPIVEAYECEQRQEWIGIMLHPSVLAANPQLADRCGMRQGKRESAEELATRLSWILLTQRYATIPFAGSQIDGVAVVPTPSGVEVAQFPKYLGKCRKKLDRLKLLAPEPKAQTKYVNTSKWFDEVIARWHTFSVKAALPTSVKYY